MTQNLFALMETSIHNSVKESLPLDLIVCQFNPLHTLTCRDYVAVSWTCYPPPPPSPSRCRTLRFLLSVTAFCTLGQFPVFLHPSVCWRPRQLSRCGGKTADRTVARFQATVREFDLTQMVRTGSGAHPACCNIDTGDNFHGCEAAATWSWPLNE